MKPLLPVLAAVLLGGFAAQGRNLPAGALGTARYDVRYVLGGMNTKVATATITLESASREGQPVYHSGAVIRANSIFKLFMRAQYTADTWLSREDLAPVYFINPFHRGGKDGKYEYFYRQDQKRIESVTVPVSGETVETAFPLDGRTMDLLSLLNFVRFYSFAGKPVSVHVLMAGKSYPARLSWQGADPDRFPGRQAERLLFEMTGHGLMENGSGNLITVWRSAGPDRQLLGLEAALSSGSMYVSITQ